MNRHSSPELDEELVFAPELPEPRPPAAASSWKVLVVDDDEVIHGATRIALEDFRFDGRPLTLLGAFSAREGRSSWRRTTTSRWCCSTS